MKIGLTSLATAAALLGVFSEANAQISFNLLADVSLNSTTSGTSAIGNNPSALAWNGTDAWLGGYNNSGATGSTSIVRLSNVLTAPTFGTSFGTIGTNNGRGFTDLQAAGTSLYSSWDNGSGNGSSIRAFNTGTETQIWNIGGNGGTGNTSLRGNGVAIDPGFAGSSPSAGNLAFVSIGAGRRQVLNAATGAYIYSQSGGPAPNGFVLSGSSTTFRDIDFDPVTGDVYVRESNRVFKGTRTGDNSITGYAQIGTQATAQPVDNQNLDFVNSSVYGDFIILNDRQNGNSTPFINSVKAISKTGTALTLNFGSFAPSNGNNAYDFAFDSGTQTLAVSDFTNRRLYVFGFAAPVPEPGSVALGIALFGGMGSLILRRKNRK